MTVEAALAAGPDALFALLAARLAAGGELLTLLAVGPAATHFVRPYSNRHDQFPLGEADKIEGSPWLRRLFAEQSPIIANDIAAILDWLPEFTDAASMGYGSLLNLPIVVGGRVVGLLNMMGPEEYFDPVRMDAIRAEIPLAALGLMAALAPLPGIEVA